MEMVDKKTLKSAFASFDKATQVYDKNETLAVDVDLSLCSEEELPRMVNIVNRLAKSEAGKETLEIAAEAGYKFGFLDAGTNCFGCCFGGSMKAIGLGPMASDDKLVSTLCHESRHAGQGVRMVEIPDRDELNVASIIRSSRAKEADAQAYAVKACKELDLQGDAGPLATFKQFYPPIYDAFEKSFAQHGEMNNAVVADVFKGWYDQKGTKQNYEEGYILDPMHDAIQQFNKGTSEDTYSFAADVDSATVVDKIGWTKEGNYLAGENPNFLNDDSFLSIGKRTKEDCQDFFQIRKDKMGTSVDKSVDSMPTHQDAFARKLPQMGQAQENQAPTMDMGGTITKWNAILAQKGKAGR